MKKLNNNQRTTISENGIEQENAFLKQEISRLYKELSVVKGNLKRQKQNPDKDRVIKQLQRENAKLRCENRKLFDMSKGHVRGIVRKACSRIKIKNADVESQKEHAA